MKRQPERGFTLTELVLVIVIAAILAAAAYSKLDLNSARSGGYTAQAQSAIRYAQKVAVAQRRNVYVCVTASSLSLYYTADCSTTTVPQPPTADAFVVNPPSGVTLAPVGSFFFDSLGRPSASTVLTVSSSTGPQAITVEGESGFVH